MRVLLAAVNAKYIHSNLGLYSICSYAFAHGVPREDLMLAEYTINQGQGEILADIYRKKPDFLAFSCYIWNISYVKLLAAKLHKILPDVPVWVGGPEVSWQPEQMIEENPWLTGVMVGEGEALFVDLYHAYADSVWELGGPECISGGERESGPEYISGDERGSEREYISGGGRGSERIFAELSDVRGIVYRDHTTGKAVRTAPRPLLSMDEMVFPYGDLTGLEHRIIYYETSRGCPFGCSYCLSSVDRGVRLRSMELVERELQFFLDKKVPQVKFVDRTFNCQKEHTMAIWKYIHEHDNGVTNFHFELSADLLTEEEICFLKRLRPGLVQFEIGVQTANPDTLRAIRRADHLDQIRENTAKIRQVGNIHQHLDLIAGLPYEDYDSFRHSFNEVYAMKPNQLQLGFLKLLRGSPVYEERETFGIVCQDEPPYEVLFTKWLSFDDVLRLKQVEDMVERYYNSMQFVASLPYVIKFFPDAFYFFQALGEYFQEKGYTGFHQSRLQNYDILLEFCGKVEGLDGDVLRQLLVYDLYARENLKARPAFAGAELTGEQKELRRRFYQDEKLRLQYLPEYASYGWKQAARMTHMEFFHFCLPEYLQTGEVSEGECVLLFDYQKRDPLNYQAGIVEISKQNLDNLLNKVIY